MNISTQLVSIIKSERGRKIIIAAGITGIILIALSNLLPKSKSQPTAAAVQTLTAAEFIAQTEQRLSEIISGIDGAGSCRVMVTLENGVEYVYASQQKINSDHQQESDRVSQRDGSESNVILVDTANGRQGLIVTELQPTVRGVVVVCEGGDNAEVRQRVTDTVKTALNITARRVCVTKSA